LDNAKQEEIKLIARLRLARVVHAEGKDDEALQLLSIADAGKFAPAYDELKGDIYVAKGDPKQAKTHYDLALQGLEPTSRARRYIEMKRDDLGLPATEVENS
jgi:predicted negative regulator of RcsB-dependent stress response